MKTSFLKLVTINFLLLVVLPLISNAQQVTNKEAYSKSPNMPQHYASRVAIFEKQPIVTGKILFLGNSITEGGRWGELLGDTTVINCGISGDVSFGVLDRLNDVINRKPQKVFLLIGINDMAQNIPDEVIAENCGKIAERIRKESPDTKVYLQSILPVNPTLARFPKNYNKLDHVIATNKLLKKAAKKAKCTYVDLFSQFLNKEKLMDPKYTGEGLHLNAEGYKHWVAYLKEKGYL